MEHVHGIRYFLSRCDKCSLRVQQIVSLICRTICLLILVWWHVCSS